MNIEKEVLIMKCRIIVRNYVDSRGFKSYRALSRFVKAADIDAAIRIVMDTYYSYYGDRIADEISVKVIK